MRHTTARRRRGRRRLLGPEPDPQLPQQPGLGPASRLRPRRRRGPQRCSAPAATVDVDRRRSTRCSARDDVDAVAIATPAAHPPRRSRWPRCEAGKHVLVEKPLADSVARRPRRWSTGRASSGLVLMVDHTYCYTPAVLKIRELIADGRARRDPVRRLGAHQPRPGPARRRRVLGPRSARPVDPRLRPARRPDARSVSPRTAPTRSAPGKACVGYLTLPLSGGAIAHVHVNWLQPDQDPPDGDRRQPSAPWSGTT